MPSVSSQPPTRPPGEFPLLIDQETVFTCNAFTAVSTAVCGLFACRLDVAALIVPVIVSLTQFGKFGGVGGGSKAVFTANGLWVRTYSGP